LLKQEKLEDGLVKILEALKVCEEINDKRGIADIYRNIASYYSKIQNFDEALYYYFKSLDKHIQIGTKGEQNRVIAWINLISEKTGRVKFKELASLVYKKLDSEAQKNIQLKEFFNEPQIRESPKVGRNDPCPCESGKKYKNCHGKNE
jgi:tetratricopeptide (TPR) repeat protein